MTDKLLNPTNQTFSTRKREAKFWEEHFNQAWDQGKPVKISSKSKRKFTVTQINRWIKNDTLPPHQVRRSDSLIKRLP